MQKQNIIIEEKLDKFVKEELRNCTFTPKINSTIATSEYDINTIPERHMMWHQRKEEKLDQKRAFLQISELMDCPFKPSLDKYK